MPSGCCGEDRQGQFRAAPDLGSHWHSLLLAAVGMTDCGGGWWKLGTRAQVGGDEAGSEDVLQKRGRSGQLLDGLWRQSQWNFLKDWLQGVGREDSWGWCRCLPRVPGRLEPYRESRSMGEGQVGGEG